MMQSIYPNLNDKDLGEIYKLESLKIAFKSCGTIEFSIYTSADGENFYLLEKARVDISNNNEIIIDGKNTLSRYIRVFSEYASNSTEIVIEKIDFKGEKTDLQNIEMQDICIESFENSKYNVSVSDEDTIDEVYGIISRNIGEKYCDWFKFEIISKSRYDCFSLSNEGNKIKIVGTDGVCLAYGLNYYLKYFCKVNISQVGSQVKMPDNIIPVDCEIYRETKAKIRYAYNYCTHSYTMAFWGEKEWRKELDWLALNGVNTVLDITAQEEVWRRFLSKLGYSLEEIKRYIAGPAFYAWAYMANLYGHGGPVHNSWFKSRTELARKNQLIMRRLGISPVLQGYSGMVPIDIAEHDRNAQIIEQGDWCEIKRPFMLNTVSDSFKKYAELFYTSQQEVYGNITRYYATDPFHEGGRLESLKLADVSSSVLNAMLEYDKNAVWIIQAWEGNPKSELLAGIDKIENGKKHALVLDLYAEKLPHYLDGAPENESYGYSPEFDKTPWVYCMINNFGGRLGIYGHLDKLVAEVPKALNEGAYNVGIGIAPEASCNNPVLYDFLFDCIWQNSANEALPQVDIDDWLCDYSERRYGYKIEACERAWKILKNTVYNSVFNDIAQGAPESISNARPALEIKAASTWGNSIIKYSNLELIKAAELLLENYEQLKIYDTYVYDTVSILQQLLSNRISECHNQMKIEYMNGNAERFQIAADKFLSIIDCMEKVTSCNEHYMLGCWIDKARELSKDTDDFTRMLFEMNAKQLITTWGSYDMAITLHDYSNRQWSGMFSTFYKPRWEYWIDEMLKDLNGAPADTCPDWFKLEWSWVREQREFDTVPEKHDLKKIFEFIKGE